MWRPRWELAPAAERLIAMRLLPKLLTVVVILFVSVVVTIGSTGTPALACDCSVRDPIGELDDGIAAFTGLVTDVRVAEGTDDDRSLFATIDIAVDEVLRGDVAASVTVYMELDTGCGTDPFDSESEVVLAIPFVVGDRMLVGPCGSLRHVADGLPVLATPPVPTSTGAPAVLITGVFGPADVILLDDAGDVVSVGAFDGAVRDAAHCAGSDLAVLQLLDPERLLLVDLDTMREVRALGVGADFDADGLACLSGGELVVQRTRYPIEGYVAVGATSAKVEVPGADWRGLPQPEAWTPTDGDPSLMAVAPPTAPGTVALLDAATLTTLSTLELDGAISVRGIAVDPTLARLAVLVEEAESQAPRPNGSSLVFLDIEGTELVRSSAVSLVDVLTEDPARMDLEWVDQSHVAVLEAGSESRTRVISTAGVVTADSGEFAAQTPVVHVAAERAVFVDEAGVRMMTADGSIESTSLTAELESIDAFAPVIGLESVAGNAMAALERRTPGDVIEEVEADPGPAAPGTGGGDGVTTSGEANSDGIAWPVVIIGGLIIVAGLVALRGEVRNLRRRRRSA